MKLVLLATMALGGAKASIFDKMEEMRPGVDYVTILQALVAGDDQCSGGVQHVVRSRHSHADRQGYIRTRSPHVKVRGKPPGLQVTDAVIGIFREPVRDHLAGHFRQ